MTNHLSISLSLSLWMCSRQRCKSLNKTPIYKLTSFTPEWKFFLVRKDKFSQNVNILREKLKIHAWNLAAIVNLNLNRRFFYINALCVSVSLCWGKIELHGAFNRFSDFFVQAFRIDVDTWKFSMWLLYIFWDDWLIFMISASNEQLQQQLKYTLLKPDCHC